MAAKVEIDVTANTKGASDAFKDVANSTDQFNKALARLIEQEKNTKVAKEAEDAFRRMSDAEKDAFLQAQKLAKETDDLNRAEQRHKKTTEESVSTLASAKMAWTELQSKIAVAKEAIQAAQEVYGASIGKVMEYAEQVRQMTAVSGASAEEASRLAQVFDDLGLETSDLEAAMESAARKGVVLNTEKLAQLSDEYLSLQTREEKQQFLQDNLGRSGFAYARVLEQGGDKLREMSAAIERGNILTDEDIAKTERLRIANDNLGDSWQALVNSLSMDLIPTLATFVEHLNNCQIATDRVRNSEGTLNDKRMRAAQIVKELDQATRQQLEGMGDLRKEEQKQAEDTKPKYTAQTIAQSYAIRAQVDALEKQKAADEAAGIAAKEHAETEKQAFADLATAQDQLATAQQNWVEGAAGDVAGALEAAHMSASKLAEAYGIVDEVMGTNLKTQNEYKTTYEKLVADFASGKINSEEFKTGLENLKTKFGELDTSVENSKKKIKELQDQIDQLHGKDITITINGQGWGGATDPTHDTRVNTEHGGSGAGSGKIDSERAAGGAVYTGQNVLVGEEGPEVLHMNQSGTVIPTKALGGPTFNNCSFTIPANNPRELMSGLQALANPGG